MYFSDEPIPGEPLPVLPGHSSPGRLERVLRAGGFAVTASVAPPASASPAEVFTRAHVLDGYADALVVDRCAPGRMSGFGAAALLARRGYSVVLSLSEVDLASPAIESEILAIAALGVANVLCDSGPDTARVLAASRTMRDQERLPEGPALAGGPRVFIGAAVGPRSDPECVGAEVARFVDAGAQYVLLDGFHDLDFLDRCVEELRAARLHERCFLVAGVDPGAWSHPDDGAPQGARVPESVLARLRRSRRPRHEARRLCMEALQRVRELDGVTGVHVRAPDNEEAVSEIVDASGVLASRVPWYPGRISQDNSSDRRSVQ